MGCGSAAASQPPEALSFAASARAFRKARFAFPEQPFGLVRGGVGQVSELSVLAPHRL